MKRKIALVLFIFFSVKCLSQEKHIIIKGKIFSFKKKLSNVHIINLKNGQGSISNKDGEFEINVCIGDTLLISSLQYERKKMVIDSSHISSGSIKADLIPRVNKLNEVFLKGLTGHLEIDLKATPKDTIPKHSFVFKPSDLNKRLPPDTNGPLSSPNALKMTDPNYIPGSGGGAGIPNFAYEKEKKLKRWLKTKKEFPGKIKRELGIDFFTSDLEIPEELINQFISSCEYRNIIRLYNNNKLLEVIEIFQDESTAFKNSKKEVGQ